MKTVAWTSLKAGLPPSLLALATALGIRYFPTPENLEILDDAWADQEAAKEMPSVFTIKKDETQDTRDNSQKQLTSLVTLVTQQNKRMQSIEDAVSKGTARVNNINGGAQRTQGNYNRRNNYNRTGNSGRGRGYDPARNTSRVEDTDQQASTEQQDRARYSRSRARGGYRDSSAAQNRNFEQRRSSTSTGGGKRFPNPVYPDRADFCFYHRMFGRDAKNHDLPCAWVFPSKNK